MSIRSQLKPMGIVVGLALGVALAAVTPAASAQDTRGAKLDQMTPMERQDFGVPPTKQLHAGAITGRNHEPSGWQITPPKACWHVQGRQTPFVLFDVLGQPDMLPNAVPAAWLAQAGSFDDAVQRQASQLFGQHTQGRKDTALVFYCLSRECWMSYNAALRAVHAGYKNVLWYRGGIEAWNFAGLPTQQRQQGQQAQPTPARQPSQPPQQGNEPMAKFRAGAAARAEGTGARAGRGRQGVAHRAGATLLV